MNDNPQGYDHDEVRKPIWKNKPSEEHKIYANEDTYQTIKEINNKTEDKGDIHLFWLEDTVTYTNIRRSGENAEEI